MRILTAMRFQDCRERPLKTYILYIHDGRYAAPTLLTIDARDDDGARADARVRLGGSPHYRAIEVFDEERLVATVDPTGGD